MGKKKGKEKDKSKKRSDLPSEQPAEKPGEQAAEPESSEQSLINAMMAARESAMALQEAASAFSRQMNATNELLSNQTAQGFDAVAGKDSDAGASANSSGMAAGAGAAGAAGLAGVSSVPDMAAYPESRYAQGAYAGGAPSYPMGQSFGRATSYRSLGASRRANKAQAGLLSGAPDAMYPAGMGAPAYGYGQNMSVPGYGAPYQQLPDYRDPAYQHAAQAQASSYGAAYQGYPSPYGYGSSPDAAAQAQSQAAAKQVAAAQSAAFTAASKANAAASAASDPSMYQAQAQQGSSGASSSSSTSTSAYGTYSQNPAYAVNEDLLVGLPKFGEAPYPLPEPHEILESVPSLQSLAYGTTASQMHSDAYASQSQASSSGYSSSDAADYSYSQPSETEEDGVIFAYVEEAEPINLVDSDESKKSKKKKKRNAAEEADYFQSQQYAAASAYGSQDMEEISIPAVYGSEEGFSVELPAEHDGYAASSPEEVSAVYYEVDDSADGSYAVDYYSQSQSAQYGDSQGEYTFEGWNQDADVYESYDSYYYDDAGNVFYYDENGYPYYYGEDGNAYYYDNYDVYGGQQMAQGKKSSTGMVLGILSILLAFIPIIGIILGIIAAKKAKKCIQSGNAPSGAYTAKLLGRLGLILSIVLLLVYVGLVAAYYLALYPPTTMGAIRAFFALTPLRPLL